MKIFLIRHGEQEYPVDAQVRKIVSSPDAPLVELGLKDFVIPVARKQSESLNLGIFDYFKIR